MSYISHTKFTTNHFNRAPNLRATPPIASLTSHCYFEINSEYQPTEM